MYTEFCDQCHKVLDLNVEHPVYETDDYEDNLFFCSEECKNAFLAASDLD